MRDLCTAIIPLDPENGIECRGPASIICEEGPRCAECFALYGGTPIEDDAAQPLDLGLLMSNVIDDLTRKL